MFIAQKQAMHMKDPLRCIVLISKIITYYIIITYNKQYVSVILSGLLKM